MELNRLKITGKVTVDTPTVVLLEIANSHGIKVGQRYDRQRLVDCINEERVRIASLNVSTDLPYIARFLNHQVNWDLRSLKKCLNFTKKFMVVQRVNLSWEEIMGMEVGPQIPSKPRHLNSCMLYRLCKERNIMLSRDSSIKFMKLLIELSLDSINRLQNIANDDSTNRTRLLSVIAKTPESIVKDRLIIDREELRIVPKTRPFLTNRLEAIYKAFCLGVDITDAEDPVFEYLKLRIDSKRYLKVRCHRSRCPELDSIDIRHRYNPLIPFDWYPPYIIDGFIRLTGDQHYLGDPESIILRNRKVPNFYLGIAPKVSNTETPISYDEVSELDPMTAISYGIPGQPMLVLTIDELYDSFYCQNNFLDPNGEPYPDNVINKLSLIAPQLDKLISEIRNFQSISDRHVTTLRSTLRNMSNSNIRQALTDVLDLSMYMRSWDGVGKYPIGSALVKDQSALETRVNKALINFFGHQETAYTVVGNLPMRLYRSGKFVKSPVGETIRERLITVYKGENIQACIRISSNWLASSAYFYQRCLEYPAPFDITAMRHIS